MASGDSLALAGASAARAASLVSHLPWTRPTLRQFLNPNPHLHSLERLLCKRLSPRVRLAEPAAGSYHSPRFRTASEPPYLCLPHILMSRYTCSQHGRLEDLIVKLTAGTQTGHRHVRRFMRKCTSMLTFNYPLDGRHNFQWTKHAHSTEVVVLQSKRAMINCQDGGTTAGVDSGQHWLLRASGQGCFGLGKRFQAGQQCHHAHPIRLFPADRDERP